MKKMMRWVGLGGLLLGLSCSVVSATSVTYIAGNFSVTTADFLPIEYPNALVNGFGVYRFTAAELDRCGDGTQVCTEGGFEVLPYLNTFAVIPYIHVLLSGPPPSSGFVVTQESGSFIGLDLGKVGTYTGAGGFGRLTISQNGNPVTANPEPATIGLMAIAGIALGVYGRRRIT
jgi:hypothetical protein